MDPDCGVPPSRQASTSSPRGCLMGKRPEDGYRLDVFPKNCIRHTPFPRSFNRRTICTKLYTQHVSQGPCVEEFQTDNCHCSVVTSSIPRRQAIWPRLRRRRRSRFLPCRWTKPLFAWKDKAAERGFTRRTTLRMWVVGAWVECISRRLEGFGDWFINGLHLGWGEDTITLAGW